MAFFDAPHAVYLMRHGETPWNREQRYQGSSDVPLSDEGRAQARRLALRMRAARPVRVLSSPLVRAHETAKIVMAENASSAQIELRDGLCEYSFGAWEGLTVDEIKSRDGDLLRRWWAAPFSERPDGAETVESILSRTSAVADEIAAAAEPASSTFVFAHGVIIRALLSALLSIDQLSALWRMRSDNCSLTIVELWGEHRPFLRSLNDTIHMRVPEHLIAELPL